MTRWTAVALPVLVAACGAGADAPWPRAPAGPLAVRAAADAAEVPLLEPVTVEVDVFWRGASAPVGKIVVPGGFTGEVTAAAPVPLSGGRWQRHRLELRPLRPGRVAVPAFAFTAGGEEAASAPIPLTVTSLLGAGAGPGLEDPRPPFPERTRRVPWLGAGMLALALLLLALGWHRQRGRPRPAPAPPRPDVAALAAIARLRAAPRGTPEEVEAFHVALADVVRTYVAARFGLHAPERTTEELLREVERDGRTGDTARAALDRFLAHCDRVKFAGWRPDAAALHEEVLATAEHFVTATRGGAEGTA